MDSKADLVIKIYEGEEAKGCLGASIKKTVIFGLKTTTK